MSSWSIAGSGIGLLSGIAGIITLCTYINFILTTLVMASSQITVTEPLSKSKATIFFVSCVLFLSIVLNKIIVKNFFEFLLKKK